VTRREFLGSDELFNKIDTDRDGLISVEEAIKVDALVRRQILADGARSERMRRGESWG
jgi:hypothetical protein